jgi:hypothetical protein
LKIAIPNAVGWIDHVFPALPLLPLSTVVYHLDDQPKITMP